MPNSLDLTANGRRLRFNDDFTVNELAAGDTVVRSSTWDTVSTEKENEISFSFDGEARTSLAVHYAFNDRNQLTLQVIPQSGVTAATDPWTLPGKIFVDDVNDVAYALIDDAGKLTSRKILVYAALSFNADHTKLRVVFSDQVETDITGIGTPGENLATEEYAAGGDLARDLLAFQAVTTNTVNGADRDFDAEIKFYGRWDLHENALVFVTHYDNTGATPVGYIALGGEIGGTNFGLLVRQDGAVVLQIAGRYAWNKNTLGWDLAVGYSKAAGLEARLNADASFQGKKGKLTLKGGAALKKGAAGTDLTLDLALTYTAENQKIAFSLAGANGTYEIKLSGDFKITGGAVKFEISASNKDGQPSVVGTVEFGYYTRNTNLKLALETTLTKSGFTLKADMQFSFYWGPNGPVAELP